MTGSDDSDFKAGVPKLRERLPDLLEIDIELRDYKPPEYKFVKSVLSDVKEVVVIKLRLGGPLPVHLDETPVLNIGEFSAMDVGMIVDQKDKTEFIAEAVLYPDTWERLVDGSPVYLSWSSDTNNTAAIKRSEFTYQHPKK